MTGVIPLARGARARRLRVNLLIEEDKETTLQRLERLISLTGGDDVVVALGLGLPAANTQVGTQKRYNIQPWLEIQQL